MMFYSVEGGLTYPVELGRVITVSPFVAAGINGGSLIKAQTNSFLLASFSGGLHADIHLMQVLSLTMAGAYSYIPDADLPMSFALISAGFGLRF